MEEFLPSRTPPRGGARPPFAFVVTNSDEPELLKKQTIEARAEQLMRWIMSDSLREALRSSAPISREDTLQGLQNQNPLGASFTSAKNATRVGSSLFRLQTSLGFSRCAPIQKCGNEGMERALPVS